MAFQSIYINLGDFQPNDYTTSSSYYEWKENRFDYGSIIVYKYRFRAHLLIIDWYYSTNDNVETIFENFFFLREGGLDEIYAHCNHTFTKKSKTIFQGEESYEFMHINVFSDKTQEEIDIYDKYEKMMLTRKFRKHD